MKKPGSTLREFRRQYPMHIFVWCAPTNSAISSVIAVVGSMVYVTGRNSAMAIVAERPGSAPKMMPTNTPTNMSAMPIGVRTVPKPTQEGLAIST